MLGGVTLPAVRHDLASLPARDRGQQDDSHNDWTYETGSAHPDLYDGRTFATVDEGVAHAQQIGFEEIGRRGMRACAEHQEASVVAGISMGVMPAWRAAQVVPGFRACIAMAGAEALDAYAPLWQPHTALQIHLGTRDPWALEGDLETARSYAATAEHPDRPADLFEYDTDRHLFMDSSTADFDADLTAVLVRRIHELLA
ncbi:dienelactone hydrolase [Micrococcus luteus]|uniref:dienelactone hydrolase n=1 Tax=Micrococcus luteus TaxID=1270 RepID=UPI0035168325